MHDRREVLKLAAVAGVAALLPDAQGAAAEPAGFTLPKLPFALDALEPHIDAKTMEIHHGKHHKAYVDNLNTAFKGQEAWLVKPIEAILGDLKSVPEAIRGAVRNNGGGHWNHTLFWSVLGKPGTKMSDDLEAAITKSFPGGLDGLRGQMKSMGLKQFG
ncbi:MAG: superoxide dismutase, partial [Gemmataceae bacterium]